jgi:hypothetical protein
MKYLFLLIASSFLFSCKSTRVNVQYNEEVDFLALQSYAWMEPVKDDSPGYISIQSQLMRKTLAETLSAKGVFEVAKGKKPDVLLALTVAEQEKVFWVDNASPYYYNRGWGYYNRFSSPTYYNEATIILAFVDPASKQALWQASLKDSSYENALPEHLQKIADALLRNYPPLY